MSTERPLTAQALATFTQTMQSRRYYETQMALAGATGLPQIDIPAWMMNDERRAELVSNGFDVKPGGSAFFIVSWRHLMGLALVLTLTSCEAKQEPPAPQAPLVVMVGTDANGQGFMMTRPVASDEEPLTDAQREAIAMREQPTIEEALATGSLVLKVANRVGWTLAVVIVASLVWVLLCKWLAALGRAVPPPQRVPDDDFTPTPFERDALCDDARDRFRRSAKRLHISRLDESRLELRNW